MRLFTGIELAPQILDNLENLLRVLRPLAKLNWTRVENLHITSKFIGEWPEDRLSELKAALAAVPPFPAITINIARFGFFPNPHRPHTFFVGIHDGPALAELAKQLDEALAPLGCAREDRPYTPHLTLARVKNDNIRDLRERIASMKNSDFGSFDAREFHLYLSKPGPA